MSTSTTTEIPAPANTDKIVCKIDGALVHAVPNHIRDNHAEEWTVARYQAEFPGEPLLSEYAKWMLAKARAQKEAAGAAAAAGGHLAEAVDLKKPMWEVFGFGKTNKACLNARGEPVMVEVKGGLDADAQSFVPDIDERYVFDIDLTKQCIAARVLNMPLYLYGMHGTGKSSLAEQVNARLNQPQIRVQHTINTEESHITGQWTVKDGETVFSYGPLPMAMIEGWTYIADEYDFGAPSVLAVYQAVLEGKPLVIKEAPPELRIVRPHPNFRFIGTGNTSGGGDETGLYQGTQMQNAANFSRFGMTIEVGYMTPALEATVIAGQAGIDKTDAAKLVEYAVEVRKAFKAGTLSTTISPRELINAAKVGLAFGRNFRLGIDLAFAKRLNKVDGEACKAYAQRAFGGAA